MHRALLQCLPLALQMLWLEGPPRCVFVAALSACTHQPGGKSSQPVPTLLPNAQDTASAQVHPNIHALSEHIKHLMSNPILVQWNARPINENLVRKRGLLHLLPSRAFEEFKLRLPTDVR